MGRSDKPKISFCTTCMGRLHHLQKTLPRNIADNADYPNLEFVVLNYGGEPETEAWVRQTFAYEIDSGLVRYASYPDAEYFRMSHAKNMAHRVATGDILCNLDADNLLGKGFAKFVAEQLIGGPRSFLRPNPLKLMVKEGSAVEVEKGTGGRIVLWRSDFIKSRGYDESIQSWGGDDRNLATRLMFRHGLIQKDIPAKFLDAISHSDEERIENLDAAGKKKSLEQLATCKGSLPKRVTGKALRFLGDLSNLNVNHGQEFGAGTVYINFLLEPTTLGAKGPQIGG